MNYKIFLVAAALSCVPVATNAAGTAKGEATDEKGQQGMDLGSKGQSST
jgi:hypothetical protein